MPGVPVDEHEDTEDFHPVETDPAAHHKLLFDLLDDLVEGRKKRAMVFMPPGSAKSTYCSVCLPPYAMGRKRGTNIITASYATPLALKQGRKARSIVKSQKYRNIFDCGLTPDNSSAHEWSLTNGNEYMAGGMLSGMTGNRADGIIIDDPVKGREAADSETIQQKTKDAYEDDLKTRLKPNGWQLIVQTRWNQSDLSGEILPEDWNGESGWIKCRDGQDWYVLCLQAECTRTDDPLGRKHGEYIWPEWFPEDHWAQYKSNPRTWSALYQQVPSPEEGTYFKREWFEFYDEPPAVMHRYGGSDYAVTEGAGDYTCHVVAGVDHNDDLYILDLWRGQTESNIWIERLLDLMSQHEPLMWAEEQGQIIKSVGPFLVQRMNERGKTDNKVYCAREQFVSIADKATRARSFQARCAMGKVKLPRNAPWVADFLSELLMFPAGKNDDQVDAAALIGRMLAEMVGGVLPEKDEGVPDRWDKAFAKMDDGEGSWKSQ